MSTEQLFALVSDELNQLASRIVLDPVASFEQVNFDPSGQKLLSRLRTEKPQWYSAVLAVVAQCLSEATPYHGLWYCQVCSDGIYIHWISKAQISHGKKVVKISIEVNYLYCILNGELITAGPVTRIDIHTKGLFSPIRKSPKKEKNTQPKVQPPKDPGITAKK